MNIAFLGTSHAALHLMKAAQDKGFTITGPLEAELVFVSEDTPTDENGVRDLDAIRALVDVVRELTVPLVLTSAVPPGFTRSLGLPHIWHQAETLRMRDAASRARNPEMMIVGGRDLGCSIPRPYLHYLNMFRCPVLQMTWEDAEFAKIAINACLIGQVEVTNALAAAARKVGANWGPVSDALRHDARIGRDAYLVPGAWEDSRHLLRDSVTLNDIWERGDSNEIRGRVPAGDSDSREPVVAGGDGGTHEGTG